MSDKKSRLGRNLGGLISNDALKSVVNTESVPKSELRKMPVELLQRGKYQPRRDMHEESLAELADSIREQGMVQPIVVRAIDKPGHYEIIAGERRWRAAQLAGLDEVPVLVKEVPDEVAIVLALVENIQRENLNPIEEAVAIKRLIDEFNMTQQDAATAVGRSRASVTNLLRLLSLEKEVKRMVEEGKLEMGHARALLGLDNSMDQLATAHKVVTRGLSVRETEALVRKIQNPTTKKPAGPAGQTDPNIRQLENEISESLGARVVLHDKKGKGTLTIHYNSLDELEGIISKIK
ncbi:MAG: ParB/RepB/Spo0J family partition protein [Gammaproteobacteria bacterium]|nr:ParB/RepB/Spo0J family partition protein [Gammaproteobacteria bacterium]MDH5593422.1 ParB/RepB/Spo0J family partition protein [Gammaproteobacteria bacterium]MDH5613455.1 ParB/RepB/Spo0J family partition protein [Gammaproteobacteria bacterium]